jgi:hypothetical protein
LFITCTGLQAFWRHKWHLRSSMFALQGAVHDTSILLRRGPKEAPLLKVQATARARLAQYQVTHCNIAPQCFKLSDLDAVSYLVKHWLPLEHRQSKFQSKHDRPSSGPDS